MADGQFYFNVKPKQIRRCCLKFARDLTDSRRDLTKSAPNLTKSRRELTKSASDLTKSRWELTKSASDLTESRRESTKSASDLTKSRRELTKSAPDLTKSTSDFGRCEPDFQLGVSQFKAKRGEIFWQRTDDAAPTGLGNFWFGFLQRWRAYGAGDGGALPRRRYDGQKAATNFFPPPL